MKAIVLLSGGLDSCVTAAIAKKAYGDLYAITFRYGQKHERELNSASAVAEFFKVKSHKIVSIEPSLFLKSSLVNSSKNIPERNLSEISMEKIPSTYVPARNVIFLSYALAYADSIDADAIFIGVNALDYSGYPDCRPEFIDAFQRVANLGTKRGVEGKEIRIETPLIDLSKAEIIKKGIELNAPLHLTWSCYRGREKACGRCDSCLLRLKGFQESGYRDPIEYEHYPDWYRKDRLLPFSIS